MNFFYAFYKVVGPGIEVSEVLEEFLEAFLEAHWIVH